MRIKTVSELAHKVAQDPKLAEQIKENPAEALAALAAVPDDKWIYRTTVMALAFAILITVLGSLALTAMSKELPEGVIALGSAAVGALAGLLRPESSK